jgi:hypothetical protein
MQSVNLKIKGLYTAPNDFSGVPEGALDQADDIVIDEENLAESRRGFGKLTYPNFPNTSDRGNHGITYQGYKIAHYGTNALAYYDPASGWQTYSGTYTHPDSTIGCKAHFFQANKNLYLTTGTGVKKLDIYNGTPGTAGIPKGLDLQLALTGASGFMSANNVLTTTGTTTNGSANLAVLTSTTGIAAGQYVYGTGIPSGTTVSSLTASSTVLISTGNITAGSTSMTNVPTNSGLVVNAFISGTGIPTGTRISAIAGAGPYTITMTASATATTVGVAVTFSSDVVVTLSANATASGTVSLSFSSGSQIAYRVLFGIRDANNNLLYGSPSQFTSITNTTGTTTNVQLTATIPSGITTSHFYQVYRSAVTATASSTPLDSGMQLVYEANPSAGDITNGYVQVTDSTPDSLRGAYLYTGSDQEGILQANDPPPYCKDACAYRTFALYANVKSKQRKKITLLSASALAVNDTITISGVVYTAKAAEDSTTGQFKLFTTGTPAQNISDTVNSLIKVINRYASNTSVYAYLISGPTDLPGQMMIEERGTGGTTFYFISSVSAAWSPNLPSSGTTIASAQDIYKNAIIASKDGQPEAAPWAPIFAGDAAKEILRIIPLREYVVILKEDGIFRMTGTSVATLDVKPFDYTTKLICPDSARALSNQVWGFFDQGVCAVSDTGVNVKSRPIETTLKTLIGSALSTIKTVGFAVGYETDRKYILSLPNASGDTATQKQYVFNLFTNAWTNWTRTATGGFIDETEDKLYLFNGSERTTSGERKTNSFTDYVDEEFSVTISTSSSYSVTLTTVASITVGDVLWQDSTHSSVVTAINTTTNVLTVQDLVTWTNGTAYIYPAISNVLRWKPVTASQPAATKQFPDGVVLFKQTRFNTATVSFYSDVSQSFEDYSMTGFSPATWGNFPWGSQPWGGVNRPRSPKFLVPQNKQNCSQLTVKLTVRNGYSTWKSEGLSLNWFDPSEELI